MNAEVERAKTSFPSAGRFGKSLDHIAELAEPEEELLAASSVYRHSSTARMLRGVLRELNESTNVVLAVTDRRLLLITTGLGGAPRHREGLAYAGMQLDEVGRRELALSWPDGTMRVKGIAKPMLPDFERALRAARLLTSPTPTCTAPSRASGPRRRERRDSNPRPPA